MSHRNGGNGVVEEFHAHADAFHRDPLVVAVQALRLAARRVSLGDLTVGS